MARHLKGRLWNGGNCGEYARWGCGRYFAADPGLHLLRTRLGEQADIHTMPYGEPVEHRGVRVSFHCAGHVLGSAQIRLEHRGEVQVVSGDYKLDADRNSRSFELVRCHAFITESTFGLPIYRWAPRAELFAEMNAWWRANRDAGRVPPACRRAARVRRVHGRGNRSDPTRRSRLGRWRSDRCDALLK